MMPAFIIFGATGRSLLLAFGYLIQAEKLASMPIILGIGREPWNPTQFRRHAEEQLRSIAIPMKRHGGERRMLRTHRKSKR